MKKLLCAVLAVILLLSCGAFALTKNEIYKAAVDSFTEYLNDNDSVSLDTLYTNFASLGTYEWSMQFMLYTDILRSVQNGSYARVSTYLTVLRSNQDFCAFLEEQSKKSKVGSVDELEAYVNANKALGQGDSAAALQYFMSCPNFLDSTARILSIENSFLQEKYEKAGALFEEGKYEEAAALFRELDGYEDSAALLETCEFLIAVLAIPEATEEEAAEEIIPEETKTETVETVEPVDDTEYVSGDYKYRKLNNGKIEITRYTGNASELSVPGEIDGFEVYGIGDYAFNFCTSIKQINLPESLAMIGRSAFQGCESLKQLSLPDGLMAIGDYAFNLCTSLTRITLPGSLVSMSSYSFGQCHSLTQITIPDNVSEINGNPFARCENLTKIIVSKEHPYFTVLDGVLFDKINKKLICYPSSLAASSYTVPNGIVSIDDSAFVDCDSLTQISLPNSVTSIGDEAFCDCDSLTQISLPDSVTSIGHSAFFYCVSLTQISLPDSVTSIGNYAFSGCDSLCLKVYTGSYAAQYAKGKDLNYDYIDAPDWLNN